MSGVIVPDEIDVEFARHGGLDLVEEPAENRRRHLPTVTHILAHEMPIGCGIDRSHLTLGLDLCAVHLPDRQRMGGIVLEQKIGLAIAVVVALADVLEAGP